MACKVSAAISGTASRVTCEPTSEIAAPAQNFRNSRCRHNEDTISDYINLEKDAGRCIYPPRSKVPARLLLTATVKCAKGMNRDIHASGGGIHPARHEEPSFLEAPWLRRQVETHLNHDSFWHSSRKRLPGAMKCSALPCA